MSVESEWALVGFTGVLVAVTGVLVWVTYRLGSITRETEEEALTMKLRPSLVFSHQKTLVETQGKFCEFGVKNLGDGNAINLKAKVKYPDGREKAMKPIPEKKLLRLMI